MATISDVLSSTPPRKTKSLPRRASVETKTPPYQPRELKLEFSPSTQERRISLEKIVLCKSRELTLTEMIQLNRQFSTLVFKEEFHGQKKASGLMFELLILDFTKKAHVSWYKRNLPYLSSNCNIINLALSKKHLSTHTIQDLKQTYQFDSVIKSISQNMKNSIDLLADMLVDHISLPQSSLVDKCYRLCQKKK